MFVNITEKPPWGSVIKAITYYLLPSTVCFLRTINSKNLCKVIYRDVLWHQRQLNKICNYCRQDDSLDFRL